MINIPFYKPNEIKVSHGDIIICLMSSSSFGFSSFSPTTHEVEFHWVEYFIKSEAFTGTTYSYQEETESNSNLGDRRQISEDTYSVLEWIVGGHPPDDIIYCVHEEEFFSSLESPD